MPASTVFDFPVPFGQTLALDARKVYSVLLTGPSDSESGVVRQVQLGGTVSASSGDIPEADAFALYALWRQRIDDLAV
jgi:hypothetical protein